MRYAIVPPVAALIAVTGATAWGALHGDPGPFTYWVVTCAVIYGGVRFILWDAKRTLRNLNG